jgi:hypothetical protein
MKIMKKMKLYGMLLLLSAIAICSACKKDWLDAKPSKALVVPATVADYQALLDNTKGSGAPMNIDLPSITMVCDGDYAITDAAYNSLGFPPEQGAYIWAATADFYGGQPLGEWINAYARILQNNVVLDGIALLKVDASTRSAYNNVKGSALFYRSLDFYDLSQEFCKVYDAGTAGADLGLPLRVSSNVNLTLSRASVAQTYDQINSDLLQAAQLLPPKPLFPTRPCKASAFGLLARFYLSQENYGKALLYADSCLQLQNDLLDYNQLSVASPFPLSYFNKEVIFHSQLSSYTSTYPSNLIVDPSLYQSYALNDLRRAIYFTTSSGVITNKTSYIGSAFQPFGGIATDEIYLTRAEGYARAGNTTAALGDLNTLLRARWKTGTFTDLTAADPGTALALILTERRKELCFRNLRWSDLRRLNKDPRFQVTLSRTVNGQTYSLAPNSPRYVLPLDPIETTTGGLQQNPRN